MKVYICLLTLVSYVLAGYSQSDGYSYSVPQAIQTYSAPSGGGYSGDLSALLTPSNAVKVYRQGTQEAGGFSIPESDDFVKVLLGDGRDAHIHKKHPPKSFAAPQQHGGFGGGFGGGSSSYGSANPSQSGWY